MGTVFCLGRGFHEHWGLKRTSCEVAGRFFQYAVLHLVRLTLAFAPAGVCARTPHTNKGLGFLARHFGNKIQTCTYTYMIHVNK